MRLKATSKFLLCKSQHLNSLRLGRHRQILLEKEQLAHCLVTEFAIQQEKHHVSSVFGHREESNKEHVSSVRLVTCMECWLQLHLVGNENDMGL